MTDSDDKLDANLVLALHALLRERSVSRAAARMGLGQPAMSHALKRLRERLDDPLLVRGDGRLMQLTPRALELADLAQQGVEAIGRVFAAPAEFDPATCVRRFRVAASDGMIVNLLPGLLPRLARESPAWTSSCRPPARAWRRRSRRAGSTSRSVAGISPRSACAAARSTASSW